MGRTVRAALKALKKGGPLVKALGIQTSKAALTKPVVNSKPAAGLGEGNPLRPWDEKLPEEVDVDVALYDWLFALEGVGGTAGRAGGEGAYSHCWHSRFEKLQLGADSSSKSGEGGRKSAPLQEVMVSLKPVLSFLVIQIVAQQTQRR